MFRNYIRSAYRNLWAKKGFSLINVIGLSIGMACCLLIFQFVAFEYSFDRFHKNRDHLYRVLQGYGPIGDKMDQGHAFTAQALAPALQELVPELVSVTRVHSEDALVSNPSNPDKVLEENSILYVDSSFMKMFTFPIITGDPSRALSAGTALISQKASVKYFGNDRPEGQTLRVTGMVDKEFVITGVFNSVPSNSHLQFDILLPMHDLLKSEDYASEPESGWSWNNFTTFIQIHPGANVKTVEKKMTDVILQFRGAALKEQSMTAQLSTQPLSDVHLNSEVDAAGNDVMGSYKTVYFFMVIGLVTFIIALVNYINLATARAANRSREVGVRKAAGARRNQLVIQFLVESALMNTVAAVIAITLATLMIPLVNDIAETKFSVDLWLNNTFWVAFVLTILGGTLLGGLYPAFVLSSFKPALVLKGASIRSSGQLWMRKGLVITQFAASIILLSGTVIVYEQIDYMRRMDLGLDLRKVLTVRSPRILPENTDRTMAMQTFLQKLRTLPAVENPSLSSTIPGGGFNWNGAAIRRAADDPSKAIRGVATYIDTTFAQLYGLKLVAGQDFRDITLTENPDTISWPVMLNESGVKSLGFSSPIEVVDELLDIGGYRARVIGVYKDFNWSSAHQARQNIVFGATQAGQYISFRVSVGEATQVIEQVGKVYNELFPGNVFSYAFADQSFDQQYRNDQRFASLFTIAAGMAIFIACMGLFGLVAFTAQQRTKEIGMRKVLGASVSGIVGLLSKDFLKLVLAGFVLAVPVTWYGMSKWLENFAYRTEIGPGVFLVAGTLALLIALVTVSWQSFRAAVANPVDSLKNE